MLFYKISKTDSFKLTTIYMLFELKFSGKISEEKYAGSLGTKVVSNYSLYTCCLSLSSVGKYMKKSMQEVLALR